MPNVLRPSLWDYALLFPLPTDKSVGYFQIVRFADETRGDENLLEFNQRHTFLHIQFRDALETK